MGTSRRATSERRPTSRARATPQAMRSLPAKPALTEPVSVRSSTPSAAWTCFLSLALVILLLVLGVIASVFVLGSSHLT
jgi:hypothetical protein